MKNNKKTHKKSKFIGKGSSACVFKPNIPCKKNHKKKNIKTKKNKVSKIIIRKDVEKYTNKEFYMNKIIKNIPNYKEWAIIWEKICKPPSYKEIKKISEIDKCLKKINKNKNDYDKDNMMLIGKYGGITLTKYSDKIFKKNTFNNKKSFIKAFLKLFKIIEPLFKGLIELRKNKICHMDLSRSNIIVKNMKCRIIDFGMSCKYSDKKYIKNRSISQFESSRIYNPYPLDFIYSYANKSDKNKEIKLFENGILREDYDKYLYIHKIIFKRNDLEKNIFYNLADDSKKTKIIEYLDVYSIGYLLPSIIFEIAKNKHVNMEVLYKCMNYKEIEKHIELFKKMTKYESAKRISPKTAYKIYKQLN